MIILYPTETIYGLGANAFDADSMRELYLLKGRDANKAVSVLVRDIEDIEKFAVVPPKAKLLAENFMPGPITLVLKVSNKVPEFLLNSDGTLGFRISSDKVAQDLIESFMEENDAPLTCTSANLSGQPTKSTVPEILDQFGNRSKLIGKIYDDGVREGVSSTVVSVIEDEVKVLREGAISSSDIYSLVDSKRRSQS